MMPFEDSSESRPGASPAALPPAARKTSWIRIVIYLCVAGLVAFGVWRIYQNQEAAKLQRVAQAAAQASRPTPVQVALAENKTMPIFLTALGTVTPNMSVTVKARVSGELLPVKFTEGDQVRQGQTIIEIDPRSYRAALEQAKGTLAHDQALLKNAQAQADRYKALFDAGVTSREVMDTYQASLGNYQGTLAADKAAVETAQLQLSWCSVQAPISGKIGLRMVDPGNVIIANTTNLIMINQFQPITVYFTVPENQLQQILHKLKAEHRLSVEAYDRGETHKIATGYLLTTDNTIDTTTGTVRLKAIFDNKDEALFPNQFVNIHLRLEDRQNTVVVPSAAIQTGLQGNYIWVVDEDASGGPTVHMQLVKVSSSQGEITILESGLEGGEKLVVDGAERLTPKQHVVLATVRTHNGASVGGAKTEAPSAGSPFEQNPAAAQGAQGGKAAQGDKRGNRGNQNKEQQ